MTPQARTVIACTFARAVGSFPKGAIAFLSRLPGNPRRVQIVAANPYGEWSVFWADPRHLHAFRLETLAPTHPVYVDWRVSTFRDLTYACHLISNLEAAQVRFGIPQEGLAAA